MTLLLKGVFHVPHVLVLYVSRRWVLQRRLLHRSMVGLLTFRADCQPVALKPASSLPHLPALLISVRKDPFKEDIVLCPFKRGLKLGEGKRALPIATKSCP